MDFNFEEECAREVLQSYQNEVPQVLDDQLAHVDDRTQSISLTDTRSMQSQENFAKYLMQQMEINELPINKNFSAQSRLLCAYDYFSGIYELITANFDLQSGEISPE